MIADTSSLESTGHRPSPTYGTRVWIIVGIAALVGVSALFFSPVPQDPSYHLFAGPVTCFGIPSFANVISNGAFTIVGLIGLAVLYGGSSRARPVPFADTLPFAVFFTGVALVGAGSAYYHWAPNNGTLFWDRLPMTIAFMSMTAAVVADRMHRKIGLAVVLPVLLVAGAASLVYWAVTEAAGRGDLRFYGLVQFLPMALIPIVCWLFPAARYTKGRYIAGMIVCYVIALVFDRFDLVFYDVAGQVVGGHTVKHLIAAGATAFAIPMWRAGAARPDPGV